MQIITGNVEMLECITKVSKKWGMYICLDSDKPWGDIVKAAPYLNKDDHWRVFSEGKAYMLFDTEEEMQRHYDMTVGDDGPTALNKHNGPVRVYAVTCSPDGKCLTENT